MNISPHKRYIILYSYILQMLGLVGFLKFEGTWGLIPCVKFGINGVTNDSAVQVHLMLLLNWRYSLLQICLFCSMFNTGYYILSEGCNNFHKMAKFLLKLLKFMAFTLVNNLQSFLIDLKDERLYIQQLALFW